MPERYFFKLEHLAIIQNLKQKNTMLHHYVYICNQQLQIHCLAQSWLIFSTFF